MRQLLHNPFGIPQVQVSRKGEVGPVAIVLEPGHKWATSDPINQGHTPWICELTTDLWLSYLTLGGKIGPHLTDGGSALFDCVSHRQGGCSVQLLVMVCTDAVCHLRLSTPLEVARKELI